MDSFKLGGALRRAGVPHWLAKMLPHRVFCGWVHEELIINTHYYVHYDREGYDFEDEDYFDHPRVESTIFTGEKHMTL